MAGLEYDPRRLVHQTQAESQPPALHCSRSARATATSPAATDALLVSCLASILTFSRLLLKIKINNWLDVVWACLQGKASGGKDGKDLGFGSFLIAICPSLPAGGPKMMHRVQNRIPLLLGAAPCMRSRARTS